jgi:hypothetical protein
MVGWFVKYEDPRKYSIIDSFVKLFPEIHKEVKRFFSLD